MTAPVSDLTGPGFPALAEAVSLTALAAVTAEDPVPDPFAALWAWLDPDPAPDRAPGTPAPGRCTACSTASTCPGRSRRS